MSRQFSLLYQIPPVVLLAPAADAAGRSSRFIDLRNALKVFVVATINQGNAAPVTLTLSQALDVSGTGAKPLTNATPIAANLNTAATDAIAPQPAGLAFTTDTGTNSKMVVLEIMPESCMDVTSGFKTISLTTSASNAANITQATAYLYSAWQAQSAPTTYA